MAVVKCPTCRTDVVWTSASPCRPFCSERCKNLDLGAWASERYTIVADDDPNQDATSTDGNDTR